MRYGPLIAGLLVGLNSLENPAAHSAHATIQGETKAIAQQSPILKPSGGSEIGSVFEAYLSPQQEPGEEEETPALIPSEFRSSTPSTPRKQRKSRGHGILRFSKDLSKVFVEIQIENVRPEDVNLFHIHCGKPDQLGPILVDFGMTTPAQKLFKNGVFRMVVTNDEIVNTARAGHGLVGVFTAGCPIIPGMMDKVKTVAGMEWIARQSELYFNLHTKAQTYFGEMRGQIHPLR
jgi:hypothetical protein